MADRAFKPPKNAPEVEREWAKSYVLIHSRLINKCVQDGDLMTALAEARSVAAALERLTLEAELDD